MSTKSDIHEASHVINTLYIHVRMYVAIYVCITESFYIIELDHFHLLLYWKGTQ